jgi:hypothetical protein
MGIEGRRFSDKHSNLVSEMKRTFLELMKSIRLRNSLNAEAGPSTVPGLSPAQPPASAAVSESGAGDVESERHVKMTPDGFPILPACVNNLDLSKKICEEILRAYLSQHYCGLSVSVHV